MPRRARKRPVFEPRLNYVVDTMPGISRKLLRGHFVYFMPDGTRIRDVEEVRRINKLAIPPAYVDVWICPDPAGHIQATGRDARGRKQYRYHADWRLMRDMTKYDRMLEFSRALPRIRERVERDLGLPGVPRERVLATVVKLLETTLIRVGNDEYAQSNKSYGLTTLLDRHVEVQGAQIRFRFRGKSGVEHDIALRDARLARIVKRCIDIPGKDLFQYLDEDGVSHRIGSGDVNEYLREICKSDFTAKDYRTWAGSVMALDLCAALPVEGELNVRKKNVVTVASAVAERLGNTSAVCRRSYIHPAIFDAYLNGALQHGNTMKARGGLDAGEVRLQSFLDRLQEAAPIAA